jgi:predicted MFS family arabinose efflux permease
MMAMLGSMALGKIIDKYRSLREIIIIQPLLIAVLIIITHFMLENEFPVLIVCILIAFTGAPM